ncbi:hypothetical protein [Deinococcus sp. Leaf326]|uniref:hypothetical protein n=1 Tax=Deinococcus sp. Leaf326 TaxID=1736338 RepID=UPI0006F6DEA4|nr:hypothetical protein [Deinococcus sp. Leaf326]KQR33156.1 hypothetical protein ASF71_16835 [Deinococcus sp. Leaf326]
MKVQVQAKQLLYTGELVNGGEDGQLGETLRLEAGFSRVVVLKNAVAVGLGGTRRHTLLVIDGAEVLSIGIPDEEADSAAEATDAESRRQEAQRRESNRPRS